MIDWGCPERCGAEEVRALVRAIRTLFNGQYMYTLEEAVERTQLALERSIQWNDTECAEFRHFQLAAFRTLQAALEALEEPDE